jgi:phage shock protein A
MKKSLYWLMGDRAGRVIESTWSWLWSLPLEKIEVRGQALSIALAKIQQNVARLSLAIAKQDAAYKTAQNKYAQKLKEYDALKKQAILAEQMGQEEAVCLAVTQLIQLENLLPQIEQRLQEALNCANTSKKHLKAEQFKIEQLKQEIQTAKDLDTITQALNEIFTIDCTSEGVDQDIKWMVDTSERQFLEITSLIELGQQPSSQEQLSDLFQNEEIKQRRQQIKDEVAQLPNAPADNRQ